MCLGRMIEACRNLPANGWPASRLPPTLTRPSPNAIVNDTQNQLHRVIAFSLPDDGRAHAVPEPLLHGAERIRILFVVAPDVLGFSPEAKIIRSDIKRGKVA